MEEKIINIHGVFDDAAIPVHMVCGKYRYLDCIAVSLVIAQDTEDYFRGEPWTDVTVALDELQADEFALDNDFRNFTSPESVTDILTELTDDSEPHRYIQSGFVRFPVYRFRKTFLTQAEAE